MKKGHFALENLDKYDIPDHPSDTPMSAIVFRDTISLVEGLQIESRNAAKVDTTFGAKTLC